MKENPHLVKGNGKQVAIITLWTKKEHVLSKIPKSKYAVASQLYSRDEGISMLVRNLLLNKEIRDIVVVGADLNRCADTLFALWTNGVEKGQVKGAPGYVDTEIPTKAIDSIRDNVKLHDKRSEKDYEKLVEYIDKIKERNSWGEPEEFPEAKIEPPEEFPTVDQFSIRNSDTKAATIELAHLLHRFGTLHNVQIHLTSLGNLPYQLEDENYSKNLLEDIPGTYGEQLHHKYDLDNLELKDNLLLTLNGPLRLIQFAEKENWNVSCYMIQTSLSEVPLVAKAMFELLRKLTNKVGSVTITAAKVRPTRIMEELVGEAHVLRRSGDPRSNILIRIKDGRINITHLSPEGKRLEEFNCDSALEAYKRLIVEHRITDLSHAAYLGYELAKAESAIRKGEMYEQDSRIQ